MSFSGSKHELSGAVGLAAAYAFHFVSHQFFWLVATPVCDVQ